MAEEPWPTSVHGVAGQTGTGGAAGHTDQVSSTRLEGAALRPFREHCAKDLPVATRGLAAEWTMKLPRSSRICRHFLRRAHLSPDTRVMNDRSC